MGLGGMALAVLLACAGTLAHAASIMDQLGEQAGALANPLSGMLSDQLGVTSEQAEGGIGSMLSLASERLSTDDFEQLAGAIPGAQGYLETATRLGAVTEPLKNLTDLNAALQRLGISPDVAAQFVPTVTDLVGKVGGDQARQLLSMALGGA